MAEKTNDLESFKGIAGRVLMGALSVEAVFTGLVVVGFIAGAQFALSKIGQSGLTVHVTILFVSILLTRFALNGRAGERRGFLFSEEGGPAGEVFSVGFRFLALWAIWLVPLELVGLTPTRLTQTLMNLSMGQSDPGTIAVTAVVILLMSACPAIFLVLAVGSPGFLDVFVPRRWVALFKGRLSDLFSIYVVHLGAVGVVMLIATPLVFASAMIHPMAGKVLNWVTAVVIAGMGVDLLGRLCGFFVLSGDTDWTVSATAKPDPTEDRDSYLAPVVAGVTASDSVGAMNAMTLPELDDARERIENIVGCFAGSPDRALFDLEDLRSRYAPHPLVLHSLCLLYERAGRREESVAIAPQALSVCLRNDADRLAAEIFSARIDMARDFALDQKALLRLAEALHSHDNLGHADSVFRMVLEQSPEDRGAIKGLLKLGESCLRADPERARRIYAFLLETAGNSPLSQFMRDGLAEAERRLAA